MSYLQAQPVNRNQAKVEEIEDGLNTEAVHGGFKCSQCFYETNDEKDLEKHLNTHKELFQCDICKMNYSRKSNLKFHIKNKHTENGCGKDYQCSECIYQTNYKCDYQRHVNEHRDIKPIKCDICMKNFSAKNTLKRHMKNKHTENGGAKDYRCSDCSYQTNYKCDYVKHVNVHSGIKPFECGICQMKFTQKGALKLHIMNKHTKNECAKDYQCSECKYQTNVRPHYQRHLNGHRGIKPFECGICNAKYTVKGNLRAHIKNKHTENDCAKDYQCSKCFFQTNYKSVYQRHLNKHSGIKPFECNICKMKFPRNDPLKLHIKNKHTENGFAKDYQCSECNYQTNDKCYYRTHLNGHRGIKPFECGICNAKYTVKRNLRAHIKNKHTENDCAKDYQCSECSFQTNYRCVYRKHLKRHSGIKPFECGICKTNFARKDRLKSHIKNIHRVEVQSNTNVIKGEFK